MSTVIGTFEVEDAFHITGRGLVLAGTVSGAVATGHYLLFPNGNCWKIVGINAINTLTLSEKHGLLVAAPVTSRQALLPLGVFGSTAQIVAL